MLGDAALGAPGQPQHDAQQQGAPQHRDPPRQRDGVEHAGQHDDEDAADHARQSQRERQTPIRQPELLRLDVQAYECVRLAEWPGTAALAYLPAFAALDWQLGRLSVCVDRPALAPSDLARVGLDRLPDARVTLQAGLYLRRVTWAVDELIQLYLADASPDAWHLREDDGWLEVRGTRGTLRFARLDAGTLAFRTAIASGTPLAEAADGALALDDAFEPAPALMALITEGLITDISVEQEGPRS